MKNIDFLSPFHGQYAEVRIKEKRHFKVGLINKSGEFVIPTIYDGIFYNGGDLVAVNIGLRDTEHHIYAGKWGVVNLKNEFVIPLKYSQMEPWEGGTAFTVCYRNRWGAINQKGETIIKFMFDILFIPNEQGLICAQMAGKCGWIDTQGKVKRQFLYDQTSYEGRKSDDHWVGVRQGDEWFYINMAGKRILL